MQNVLTNNRLETCEQTIEKGLQSFVKMGEALREIRDKQLFKPQYSSFRAYCRERWNMGDSYTFDVIRASGVVKTLQSAAIADTPRTESVARELAPLPEEEQIDVWREILDTGDPITAKVVKRKVRSKLNKKNQLLNEIKETLSTEEGVLSFDPSELRLAEHAEEIMDIVEDAELPAKLIEFQDVKRALEALENDDWMYQLGFRHQDSEGYGGELLHDQSFHKMFEYFGAKGWEVILKRLSLDGVPMRHEWREEYHLPVLHFDLENLRTHEVIARFIQSPQWSLFESGLNSVYSADDVRENIGIEGREWLIKYLGISISNDEVAKNYLIAGYFQTIRNRNR